MSYQIHKSFDARTGRVNVIGVSIREEDDIEIFQQLIQRATNLWPDAPAWVKEFADVIIDGTPKQNYKAQEYKHIKSTWKHLCPVCHQTTTLIINGTDAPTGPIRCTQTIQTIISEGKLSQPYPCNTSFAFNNANSSPLYQAQNSSLSGV